MIWIFAALAVTGWAVALYLQHQLDAERSKPRKLYAVRRTPKGLQPDLRRRTRRELARAAAKTRT